MLCFDGVMSGCAVFDGVMMVCFDGVMMVCFDGVMMVCFDGVF